MPFEYILAQLVADNDRAVGAMFLDDRGEAIDFACAESSPYEMKVAGAYLGIYLRNLGRFLTASEMGTPQVLHIERDGIHIHVTTLPDGYCLALMQRPPALVARARQTLAAAAEQLSRELFPAAHRA
jgi:hypothetical protein